MLDNGASHFEMRLMQESLFGVVMSDVSAPLHEILRQILSVGERPLMIVEYPFIWWDGYPISRLPAKSDVPPKHDIPRSFRPVFNSSIAIREV